MFTHPFDSFIFPTAGNGERYAGFPPSVQWEAERFDSLGRTQRADHYGEIKQTSPWAAVTDIQYMELKGNSPQALYDYLPSENDLQPLLAWLAVMEKAHIHLAR